MKRKSLKFPLIAVFILMGFCVNAQDIKDFVGEYQTVKTTIKVLDNSVDTNELKSTSSTFSISLKDLVNSLAPVANEKINISTDKLILTQGDKTKEYVFKNVVKEKDDLFIKTTDNDAIVLSRTNYGVLSVKINDEYYLLKISIVSRVANTLQARIGNLFSLFFFG